MNKRRCNCDNAPENPDNVMLGIIAAILISLPFWWLAWQIA